MDDDDDDEALNFSFLFPCNAFLTVFVKQPVTCPGKPDLSPATQCSDYDGGPGEGDDDDFNDD